MAMGAPASGTQVHFHIPGAWSIRANLQHGSPEIGPAFHAGETRMKHAHAFSGNGFEFGAAEPLVLPDCLDEPFGRKPFVAQTVFGADTGPPLGVDIIGELNQALLLLEFWRSKVNFNRCHEPNVFARSTEFVFANFQKLNATNGQIGC
jgi:hypothetical protein